MYEDKPNLSEKQVADILSWLKSEVTEIKNPFCWRQSYGRGVGTPLTDCPADKDKIGALCYSKCPSGYKRFGFDCHQVCPGDFRDDGLFCRKAEYAKWPWESCRAGYENWGVACRPPTPGCAALGLGGKFDLSCAKKIIIGDPTPMVCRSGLEADAGLCYSYCKTGFHGVGPVCWQNCDTDQSGCAAACAKTVTDCALATVDQVTAPLIVAANIATLGMTTASAGAANTVNKKKNQTLLGRCVHCGSYSHLPVQLLCRPCTAVYTILSCNLLGASSYCYAKWYRNRIFRYNPPSPTRNFFRAFLGCMLASQYQNMYKAHIRTNSTVVVVQKCCCTKLD